MAGMNSAKTSRTATDNPLLENWTSPFGVPPFARIRPEHFLPAFTTAFAAHAAEVAAIASDPAEPSFANTIEALEQAGETLNRISNTFHVLAKAHTNDALLAAERELAQIAKATGNCVGGCVTSFRSGDRPWVGCSTTSWPLVSPTCRNVGNYKTYFECKDARMFLGARNSEAWWYCSSLLAGGKLAGEKYQVAELKRSGRR